MPEAGSITRSKLRKKSNRALWWNDNDIALGQRVEDGIPGCYGIIIRDNSEEPDVGVRNLARPPYGAQGRGRALFARLTSAVE